MSSTVPTEATWSDGPGILDSMWRYKVGVMAAFVACFALGYLGSNLLPTKYQATARILIANSNAFEDQGGDPERKVQQEASRLTSRAVFARAARQLGQGVTAISLKDMVEVQPDPVVGLLEIIATSDDPDRSAEISNAVMAAYEQERRQAVTSQVDAAREVLEKQGADVRDQVAELEAQTSGGRQDAATELQLEILRSRLAELETRVSTIAADAALFGAGIDAVEPALPPNVPSSPKPVQNAALAGTLGLGIASALAYWRAGVVDRSQFDLTTVLGAPLLAAIPQFKRSANGTAGDPLLDLQAAEAYQFLLTSVEYVLAETDSRSILVTSASPGDGKSLTSLHLAKALATQGRGVILVDADIRERGLSSLLRAGDEPGLVALAEGWALPEVIRRYRISPTVGLPVIPAGAPPHQPTGLLATDRYRDAIARIIEANELTIIDGGPLLTVADASAIAAQVAGIVLILDAKTPREDVIKVQERLRLIPTPLLGLVLNRVPTVGQPAHPYGPAERWAQHRLDRLFGGKATSRHIHATETTNNSLRVVRGGIRMFLSRH